MKSEPFKKCGCKDADRKNLYRRCPRLSERNHGGWFYRYSEPTTPGGARRQPLIGPFPTKTAASTDQIERLDRVGKGLPNLVDRKLKIADDFDRWCQTRTHLSSSTRLSEAEIGKLYVKPGIGHLLLADLRPHHLEDLYAAIRRIGRPPLDDQRSTEILQRLITARGKDGNSRRRISGARLQRIHDVLRGYFAQRTHQEIIPRNPATHIKRPRSHRPEALIWTDERIERWLRTGRRPSAVMVWTPEQTGMFLDFADEDRNYALWHLIAFRGLRRGEAVDLNRSELNFPQSTLTVRTSHRDTDDDDDFESEDEGQVTTKNRRSRTLSLDKITLHALAAHRAVQLQQQAQLGNMYEDSGLVFTDELGRQLVLKSVSQQFMRLIARFEAIRRSPERPRGHGVAKTAQALASQYRMPLSAVELALAGPPLPPIRLHDLRHGAASLTYRATRDLKLVSVLLGHSGIQITSDTYTTLFQEVDSAAAEAVSALVPRNRPAQAPKTAIADIIQPDPDDGESRTSVTESRPDAEPDSGSDDGESPNSCRKYRTKRHCQTE